MGVDAVGRGPAALKWDFLRGGHAYCICKIIYEGGTSRVGGHDYFSRLVGLTVPPLFHRYTGTPRYSNFT